MMRIMHNYFLLYLEKSYISNVVIVKYLEYISGKNFSTSTATIPFSFLFLWWDKNSYLKSFFYLLTSLLL